MACFRQLYVVHSWAVYFCDNKSVLPYTATSVRISSVFSIYCFNYLRMSHLKACIHTLKKKHASHFISYYLWFLQIGGAGNLILGITSATAASQYISDPEIRNGKLDICYQRRSMWSLCNNLKESEERGYQALFFLTWTQDYISGQNPPRALYCQKKIACIIWEVVSVAT